MEARSKTKIIVDLEINNIMYYLKYISKKFRNTLLFKRIMHDTIYEAKIF